MQRQQQQNPSGLLYPAIRKMTSYHFVTHKNSDCVAAEAPDVGRCCHSCFISPQSRWLKAEQWQVTAGDSAVDASGHSVTAEHSGLHSLLSHPVTLSERCKAEMSLKYYKSCTYNNISATSARISFKIIAIDLIWFHCPLHLKKKWVLRCTRAEKLKHRALKWTFFHFTCYISTSTSSQNTLLCFYLSFSWRYIEAPSLLPLGKPLMSHHLLILSSSSWKVIDSGVERSCLFTVMLPLINNTLCLHSFECWKIGNE